MQAIGLLLLLVLALIWPPLFIIFGVIIAIAMIAAD